MPFIILAALLGLIVGLVPGAYRRIRTALRAKQGVRVITLEVLDDDPKWVTTAPPAGWTLHTFVGDEQLIQFVDPRGRIRLWYAQRPQGR